MTRTSTPTPKRRLRRWLRGIAVFLSTVVLFFLGAYGLLAWYVHSHKEELLARINSEVSNNIDGTLHIGDMKASLWGDFPHASVVVHDVYLRDSLWARHRHDLFRADEIFIRLNPLRLLSRRIDIRKLTMRGGRIFIFTDSSGYTNKYLLKRKDTTQDKGGQKINFRSFALHNVSVEMEDAPKLKSFGFVIRSIEGNAYPSADGWNTTLDADVLADRMIFNKTRGSFLKRTPLKGRVFLTYNTREKDLAVRAPALRIDGQPVLFQGRFSFLGSPPAFNIHLETKAVAYKRAVSWVSDNISSKLQPFDFTKPVDLTADLNGHIKFRDTPEVIVRWNVRDNTLKTPHADFEHISFGGYFVNEQVKGRGHGDVNSSLYFLGVNGQFESIPFTADTIAASNLLYPLLNLRLRSAFDLKKVNDVGDLPLSFLGGHAELNLHYRGGISRTDTLYPHVDGTVSLTDAAFTYLPRGLSFSGVQAVLRFSDDNLYFQDLSAATPGGPLQVQGAALHFFRFFFSDPGKVNIFWRINSPGLNLNHFGSLAGRRLSRRDAARKARNPGAARFFAGLDKLLKECTATLALDLRRLQYRSFVATDMQATVAFSKEDVQFVDVGLHTGGGTMTASGHIAQASDVNPFALKADFRQVGVKQLFHAFDNFGQDALQAPNLEGHLTAVIDVAGRMGDGGKVVKRSLNGSARFVFEEGGLKDFEPFRKIGRFAFKKRNLDHVRFERIENTIRFRNGIYVIPPLVIRSTAFNMKVQGTYGPPSGTDLTIVLPLGNPENEDTEQRKTKKVSRGLTLYLRAHDGKDGKVDIDWDPLKKGKKRTDEMFGVEE